MLSLPISGDTTALNLKRLVVLRHIVIACELLAILLATQTLAMSLPLFILLAIIGVHAVFNVLTWYRLRSATSVTPFLFTCQLAFDTLIFAALLYFTGGYTNPFVSIFLLPLVIAASFLPQRYTVAMALLTIGCYSLLMFFYLPLPQVHMGHHGSDFDVHVLGMWFSFLLNASLIVFFVVRMANSLRERDHQLAKIREKTLQDEHLIELGTLAAGAAHELGTPLSTMAVVVNELQVDYKDDADVAERSALLRSQLNRCKTILSDISASAGQTRAEGGRRLSVDAYLDEVIKQWLTLRPQVQANFQLDGVQPAPIIVGDKTLTQAIINILNNAADVSMHDVALNAHWTHDTLKLAISDRGTGMSDEIKKIAGTPFFTTKAEGHGLGLYLAKSVIARFSGQLDIKDRESGGTCVTITLPLLRLEIKQ